VTAILLGIENRYGNIFESTAVAWKNWRILLNMRIFWLLQRCGCFPRSSGLLRRVTGQFMPKDSLTFPAYFYLHCLVIVKILGEKCSTTNSIHIRYYWWYTKFFTARIVQSPVWQTACCLVSMSSYSTYLIYLLCLKAFFFIRNCGRAMNIWKGPLFGALQISNINI
jgi:hypothetical protein